MWREVKSLEKERKRNLGERKTEDTEDELITADDRLHVYVCHVTRGVERVTACHSAFVNLLTDSQIVDVSVTFSHMSEEDLLFLKSPAASQSIISFYSYTATQSYHIHITLSGLE